MFKYNSQSLALLNSRVKIRKNQNLESCLPPLFIPADIFQYEPLIQACKDH